MEELCREHSAHRRAIDRHDVRLDGHSEELDALRECVTRLTALQEQDAVRLHDMEQRIGSLEGAPGRRWDDVARTAATAVTAAFVGWALASIGIAS